MACYSLLNCDGITTTTIDYAPGGLIVGNVITVSPTIPIVGVANCWQVSEPLPECTGGENIVTSIYDHGAAPDGCTDCEAIVPVRIQNCEDTEVIINVNYTSLPAFTTISINPVPPDYTALANCWTVVGLGFLLPENFTITSVTDVGTCYACLNPPPPTCYTLENCIDTSVTLDVSSAIALPIAPNSFELSPTPTAPDVPLGTPNCWRLVTEKPCDGTELSVTIVTSYETCNDCMLDKQCYALTKCGDPGPTVYTKSNLLAYVGTQITSPELSGDCYTVALSPTCILPVVLDTTLITSCSCPPAGNCYLLSLCDSDGAITLSVNIVPPATLTVGNVYNIFPVPTIPPGYENCWEVIEPITCETGFYGVESVNSFDDCITCQTPPTCYKLTGCDDTVIYTQNPLIAPYLNSYVQLSARPDECFFVTEVLDGTCPSPITIIGTLSPCSCPCYILTDCFNTVPPIYTYSNLAAYVGTQVHIDEDGGCEGPCYYVELSTVPCPLIAPTITVTTGCLPCPACQPPVCYTLVDCVTKAPYITLNNPTLNGVDLGPLLGQVVSKVCEDAAGLICDYGCWTIEEGDCGNADLPAEDRYVYNVFPDCPTCLNSCFEFVNCETAEVAYTVQNVTNPLGLPNLNTLIGTTIYNLCFVEEDCPEGCFYIRRKEDGDCTDSISYDTVVSFDISEAYCCEPTCYLLTECLPVVATPIIVNNDLSLYVGSVAKICDSEGDCKCYNVELAQTCEGAITIDNASASFTTCEECNSCGCPPGYTQVGNDCQKITSVPAVQSPVVYTTTPGNINSLYGSSGTRFYSNVTALPFPLTAVGSQFIDAGSIPVPFTASSTGVWGSGSSSRLNTVGIWTTAAPNPINEWVGFTQCIEIEETGTYCIGIGGDDAVRLKLDGVVLAIASIAFFDFVYWHVFEINLTAGTHIIVLEGLNTGGPAAFGAEIYQGTIANLQTITTVPGLQPITVFSTFPFRTSPVSFQTGESSGYSCPPGATLNLCGEPSCTVIETVPFIECPITYKVTLCDGQGVTYDPIITNTDLSAYIGVSKVCIENPTFSTTNYILKDCNRIVADICTTTLLGDSLWDSIILTDYPGSCFIVTGVIEGEPCTDPIQVATLQEPCVCKPVGTPWPDGCYCVTVEEIPTQTGIDFYGTFGESFQCCEDCKQVCYLLTSCTPGINPVIVCNDLAAYVDPPRVIKITGCGDICWNVAIAGTCNTSTYFGGTITDYADCPSCLPPLPPTPPPYDLHLRKIKPGYNSPNSCYTTSAIEKINCNFADQVYNAMLVKRYGVTVCCEEDLVTWDIKKQLLDLDLLNDPSMCRSTLCDCPAPCFVSAIITLLPTCPDPYLIRATLDPLCVAPVLTSVEITVESTLPCYCYTVEVLETPVTVGYIDCCCKDVITTYTETTTFNACAIYPPVSNSPSSINITSSGLCSDECVVPPPVCICWRVVNTGFTAGEIANFTYIPCDSTIPVSVTFSSQHTRVCSYNMPIGTNIAPVNEGPCSESCTDIPPACVCYSITYVGPTCDFVINSCKTGLETIAITSGSFVCSYTIPVPTAGCVGLSDMTITPTGYPCDGLGRCVPPSDCICYEVEMIAGSSTPLSCDGVITSFTAPTSGLYNLCTDGTFDPSVTIVQTYGSCSDPGSPCSIP